MSPIPFICPSCQKKHTLFNPEKVVVYVCGNCNTVLRKKDAWFEKTHTLRPPKGIQLIPLGTTGILRGKQYTVITYTERTEVGTPYYWMEYTLRQEDNVLAFLSVYNGHWNLAEPISNNNVIDLQQLPNVYTASWEGDPFRRFSRYRARYQYASGEFDWEVDMRYGMECIEFINPPHAVIVEWEHNAPLEADLYLAEYMPPKEVSKAFLNDDPLPARTGVGALQPFYFKMDPRRVITGALLFCIGALLVQWFYNSNRKEQVLFTDNFTLDSTTFEKPRVSPSFKLGDHISNLEVEISSDITNNWCAADISLVNEQSGEERDFAVEASYYSGYEGGESWSEGGPVQTEFVCSVPPGSYHFVVTPTKEATGPPVAFTLNVVWDVPTYWNAFLLCILYLGVVIGLYALYHRFELGRGE